MKADKKEKKQKAGNSIPARPAKKISQIAFPWWLTAILILVTVLVYLPVFNAGFVHWDDKLYIQDNPLIRSINLEEIFSTYQQGNYHPVTMLVYAIEYHSWKLNATGFHAVNLLFHLLNTVLVCYVLFRLTGKKEIAFVAALFFGVHPIHVESVAWLAQLKDLLYTFFFLCAYYFYLEYYKSGKNKFYVFSLILFLLSLLSKAMAAPLPVVLLLTDYFMNRKFTMKVIAEKLPFFILAIVLGIVAIKAQLPSGETLNIPEFPFWQRIVFACHSFVFYLLHLVMPYQLNAIYPYPVKVGEPIPSSYYIYLIVVAGIIAGIIYSLRFTKKIFFAFGFFTATVFLVLQLLPIGDAIMADRYGYIPSIAIFYLAGEGYYFLKNKNRNNAASFTIVAFTLFFSFQTFALSKAWKNGMTLWNDVIQKDSTIPGAYNNRGLVLMEQKQNEEALSDFNKAIELKPDFAYAYYNRGLIAMDENINDAALKDYSEAIRLYPGYVEAYLNRGIVYFNMHKLEESYGDYSNAIRLRPSMSEAYAGRGAVLHLQQKYSEAAADYDKALVLQPGNYSVYFNLGLVYNAEKKYEDAIASFSNAIALEPGYAQAYYNRGISRISMGNTDAGCSDMKQAITLGFRPEPDDYNRKCY